MLRLLLIITLVGYVLYKLGLFRALTNPAIRGNGPGRNFGSKRPPDGNVNIDSVPDPGQDAAKKRAGYKGGEYVDYEEVK
jgi:hypothetical protein